MAGAAAPALRLAAAARATAGTSFRLRMTLTRTYETGRPAGHGDREVYAGAFDAAADRGYLRIGTGPAELRIIGADVYAGAGRHLQRGKLSELLAAVTPATSAAVGALSVDPRELLTTLRHLGTVTPAGRSGTGGAAADKYTFTYPVAADASTAAHRVTGSVEIGSGSGLLTRITQRTVATGADPQIADRSPLTWLSVIEFSDYGVPVHVEKP